MDTALPLWQNERDHKKPTVVHDIQLMSTNSMKSRSVTTVSFRTVTGLGNDSIAYMYASSPTLPCTGYTHHPYGYATTYCIYYVLQTHASYVVILHC